MTVGKQMLILLLNTYISDGDIVPFEMLKEKVAINIETAAKYLTNKYSLLDNESYQEELTEALHTFENYDYDYFRRKYCNPDNALHCLLGIIASQSNQI